MKMVYRMVTTVLVVVLVVGMSPPPGAHAAQSFVDALTSGTAELELLGAFEHADLANNGTPPATGLFLRTRGRYGSGSYRGLSVYAELQDINAITDNYAPEQPNHDLIADPDESDVYQLYANFTGLPGSRIRVGRQEILRNDQRLIGNVGWRLHAQTFDAVSFVNTSWSDWKLIVDYVDTVKTLLDTRVELDHFLTLQANYRGFDPARVSLYGYFLDAPGDQPTDRDNATYGVRVSGTRHGMNGAFDVSIQQDYQDAAADGGVMFNAFLGTTYRGWKPGVGYRFIEGADGPDRPFDTLFSTAHKFNGWTDQFTSTNGGDLTPGLEEWYLELRTTVRGIGLLGRYHLFEQEVRNQDYGDELAFLLTKQLGPNVHGLLKYGHYNADRSNASGFAQNDEDVFWVRLRYNLSTTL